MTAVKQVTSRLKRKELMVNCGTKVQGLKMWQERAVSCEEKLDVGVLRAVTIEEKKKAQDDT